MATSNSNTKITRKKRAPIKNKGKVASANNRIQKIKQTQREEIRNKFKGIEYVRQLEILGEELTKICKSLDVAVKKRFTTKDRLELLTIANQIDVLELRLKVIKERINLNLRRLKFVCPELKQVELSDPFGNNPFSSFIEVLKDKLQQ